MTKDEELEQLRQENLALREANQTLREGLLEAIQAIDEKLKRVKELEGVITSKPRAHQKPGRAVDER